MAPCCMRRVAARWRGAGEATGIAEAFCQGSAWSTAHTTHTPNVHMLLCIKELLEGHAGLEGLGLDRVDV